MRNRPEFAVMAVAIGVAVIVGLMSLAWKAVVKRAGIKAISPHGCRHGFATTLLQAGIDPATVAREGGWATPAQLFATYGHAREDRTVTNLLFDMPRARKRLRRA